MYRSSKRSLATAVVATMLVLAAVGSARAQRAEPAPPGDAVWQPVREVVFNSTTFASTGTSQDRALMAKLWAKELSGAQRTPAGDSLPGFALVATVRRNGVDYVLTMFNRAGPDTGCDMPGNGAQDLHATCPLRVAQMQGGDVLAGRSFPGYCMLAGLFDSGETARRLNRMEYAYDERAGVVRLRTIEHGRIVAACSRSIRLP